MTSNLIQSVILFIVLFHFTVVLHAIYRYNHDSVSAFNWSILFAIFTIQTVLISLSYYFNIDILYSFTGAVFIILSYLLSYCEHSHKVDISVVKKLAKYSLVITVLYLLLSKISTNYSVFSNQALIYTLSIIVFLFTIIKITVGKLKKVIHKPSLVQGMISVYYIYFFITFVIVWINQVALLLHQEYIIEQWKLYIMVTVLAVSLGLAWILGILEEIKEKAIYLSYHDSLTGLSNRRYLFEFGGKLLKENQISAVCLFDLDKFKNINDSHGHAVGDQVLINISKLINNQISDKHILSRIGGEEFCLLIRKNIEVDMFKMVEALRISLENSTVAVHDKTNISITASFGLYIYDGSLKEIDKLLLKADNCMYRAKKLGRNRVETNC